VPENSSLWLSTEIRDNRAKLRGVRDADRATIEPGGFGTLKFLSLDSHEVVGGHLGRDQPSSVHRPQSVSGALGHEGMLIPRPPIVAAWFTEEHAMPNEDRNFDLLCLGRLGVDLYGEQEGTPLAAIQTFAKYVGGSAANVCVGVARLGLSTAMCSRVGDEGLGDFVLDMLTREGINTALVQRDPLHPTGVVALAIYRREHFPRIFFYTESADLAFERDEIDWSIIRRSNAVLITGSYLVSESLRSSSRAIADSVRDRGGRVVLDVDYRPVLWGLVPVGRGNDMETFGPEVTATYQQILPLCDLVVGTEEEIAVVGGSDNISAALGEIRSLTAAAIVLKRGAKGASVYEGPIPADLDDGIGAPGYAVDVLNNTGAGDAFLSGFLSQWLRNRPFHECVQSGNASGAIVVTRNGCTPAMPFADEQTRFMVQGDIRRPDDDEEMNRLHRIGSRRPTVSWRYLLNFEDLALRSLVASSGGSPDRVDELKKVLYDALLQISEKERGVGVLFDRYIESGILEECMAREIFVTRSLDPSYERRESIDEEEIGIELRTWHNDIVPRTCAAISHAISKDEAVHQWSRLARISRICRLMEREIIVDLRPREGAKMSGTKLVKFLAESYRSNIQPDYWIFPELQDPKAWSAIEEILQGKDSACHGYFVRARSGTTRRDKVAPAGSFHGSACRGVIELPVSDPSGLGAWLNQSATDSEFIDAVSVGLLQRIQAWRTDGIE